VTLELLLQILSFSSHVCICSALIKERKRESEVQIHKIDNDIFIGKHINYLVTLLYPMRTGTLA
jgi:hypothetical protein